MIFLPVWFAAYCIITNILTSVVLFGFIIQTCIYKYKQNDELTTTFSILAIIGMIKILCSCASSYIFTIYANYTDVQTYFYLRDWLNCIRIIALFSQMLFFVWRLELTFVRTNYQLSNAGLIFYHIAIITSIIAATIIDLQILDPDMFPYIYYPEQVIRLGVFFSVAYQFMNKLFELIATQHSTCANTNTHTHTNTRYNTQEYSGLIVTISKSGHHHNHLDSPSKPGLINSNSIHSNVNHHDQLVNQLNDELKLAIELEIENSSSFRIRNYKLINIIAKLSFLACIDFVTLFLYVTFAEIYSILYYHGIELYQAFFLICFTMEPFSYLIFSLTVWFSFTFAEKQYQLLFGCCHRRFVKYFENKAKKRTIKRTIAALSPSLSPIIATPKNTSSNSIELLQLQHNVMES